MKLKKVTIAGMVVSVVIIASVITVFATGRFPRSQLSGNRISSNSSSSLQAVAAASSTSRTGSNVTSSSKSSAAIVYKNTQYGFNYYLPSSWKGYTIAYSTWEADSTSSNDKMTGPFVYIRNPKWTSSNEYDLPIMIFTHAQWTLLDNDSYTIEKAGLTEGIQPELPMEYGRNPYYIFAVPERWWACINSPDIYQEAKNIVDSKPLYPIGQIPTPGKSY